MNLPARQPPLILLLALLALALVHVGLAVQSARGTSPTYDEPLHALGAHLRWHFGEFRINPEDPPLWQYLAVVGTPRDALAIDFAHPDLDASRSDIDRQGGFVHATLFLDNPDVVHDWILAMRTRMALLGGGLVVAVGWTVWSVARRLDAPAPAWGSLVAAALVALDPNILAHSALMKNDVAITLGVILVSVALWRVGQRITPGRVLALAATLALAANLKFSGVVLGPIVAALLVGRALLPDAWAMRQRTLASRGRRLVAAAGITLVCALIGYASIWALYGLRHAPTTDPQSLFDHQQQIDSAVRTKRFALEIQGRHAEAQRVGPGVTGPMLARLASTGILPDAWVFGLHHVQARSVARASYLLGQTTPLGHWYYFPVAMLVKTPLTTLMLFGIAIIVAASMGRSVGPAWRSHAWLAIAFLGPAGVLLALAMASALNLGVRHVFPVYPVIWLTIGLVVASLGVRKARVALVIAAVGLGVETGRQAPHYLSFFNDLAGGSTGGARILSDSNLDWGQDLPSLAQWQRDNPDRKLYFSYFGSVDPAIYGIRYTNLAPGYAFGAPPSFPEPGESAVLAVSATHLQGTYQRPGPLRDAWLRIWNEARPLAVLGGSIYLYEFPLRTRHADAPDSP